MERLIWKMASLVAEREKRVVNLKVALESSAWK